MRNRLQKGQSMVEYTVIIAALITGILMVPVRDDQNCIEYLIDVMKNNYQGYSYAISSYNIEEEEE